MDELLKHTTEIGAAVSTGVGAVLAAWTLWVKVKKSAKRGLYDALDDKFATKTDLGKVHKDVGDVKDMITDIAVALNALSCQVSVRLDQADAAQLTRSAAH